MKSTKKSLLLSTISLVLCFAMLLGTTWAWFIDEVTSGVNKIVAGNLDVELYHAAGGAVTADDANKVTSTTQLFNIEHWEPGMVAYENFMVKNVGNLALKYQLAMTVGDFNKTVDGNHTLKEVLKVAVVPGGFTGTTRAEAEALDGYTSLDEFSVSSEKSLLPNTEGEKFGVVIYWAPTDNDNLYNLNNGKTAVASNKFGTTELGIELGVKLIASQLEHEYDSFGKDYDGEASYSETVAATIEADKDTVFYSAVTPSNENGNTTKVIVPKEVADFVAGSTSTMTIEATPTVAANKTFTISSNGAVGAIDLTVKVNDQVVTQFKDNNNQPVPVIVETYIAKNLTNVSLSYNNTETWTQVANESDLDQVGELYYDKITGRLLYMTNHFSTFVLGADEVAYVERTNMAYLTVSAAVNAAQTGDTVTMLKDYDKGTGSGYAYQGALVGDKDITVDLNGKEYTGQFSYGAFIAQRGKLTIEDSSSEKTGLIKNTIEANNTSYAALCATQSGTIVLNSGTVEGYGYGIYQYVVDSEAKGNTTIINGGEVKVHGYAISAFDYSKIVINGGKVTSTEGYALMNNGSDSAPSTMTITGGEVYGEAEAIYHPGPGTCTISGGKLTGGKTGIEMRAGTLNITGGTIIGNATPTSVSPNGNGMTSSGSGVAIAQHTTKLSISVTVSGGIISGYSALYESNPENNSTEDIAKVTIDVTGGEFKCINNGTVAVYSADKTGFVKGGTFSSDPTAYVASGYSATENNGIWTVAASN